MRFNGEVSPDSEAVIGVGGALIGAVVTGGLAYALYAKQRADGRRDERDRAGRSGLQAQRDAVSEQFNCAYSAKTWISNLHVLAHPSDTSLHLEAIREEAITRMNKCHEVWDMAHMQVDSQDVQTAMVRLDQEVMTALMEVAQGNMSPDLSQLSERLRELRDGANRRLDASWN